MESDTDQNSQIHETANLDELFETSERLKQTANHSKPIEALSPIEQAAVMQAYDDHKDFWIAFAEENNRTEQSLLNQLAAKFLTTKHFLAPMFMGWARTIVQEFEELANTDDSTKPKIIFLLRDGYTALMFVEFLIANGLGGGLQRDDIISIYLNTKSNTNNNDLKEYVEESCHVNKDAHNSYIVVDTGSNGSVITKLFDLLPRETKLRSNMFLSNNPRVPGAITSHAYFNMFARDEPYAPPLPLVEGLCFPQEFRGRFPFPEKVFEYFHGWPVVYQSRDPEKTTNMKVATAAIEQYFHEVSCGLIFIPDTGINAQALANRAVKYLF